MKKLILALVTGLLVWNIWLTYQLENRSERSDSADQNPLSSAQASDGTVIVNHTLNGYTTDITDVISKVEEKTVSVQVHHGESTSLLSGSIYYSDSTGCWILTSAQMVNGADAVSVIFHNEIECDAEIAGLDQQSDVALLVTHPEFDTAALEYSDSSAVKQGDYVTVVGARQVSLQSAPVSFGIISLPAQILVEKQDDLPAWIVESFLTDAQMSDEMNGAPCINLDGQLVGMVSRRMTSLASQTGMNALVSCNEIESIAGQIMQNGSVVRGYLGAVTEDVSGLKNYQKSAMNVTLDTISGVMCSRIEELSPAQSAGLMVHDVILAIDDAEVKDNADLRRILYSHQPSDTISVTYSRNGAISTVSVELE